MALASTERLSVGIGVLPAPLRNVVTTAMEIATLDAMFPGRVRVGIGHGVQDWMRQAGAAVASPLTMMREYVTALRHLFAGQSVTTDGRYVRLDNVRLHWPVAQPLAVLIEETARRCAWPVRSPTASSWTANTPPLPCEMHSATSTQVAPTGAVTRSAR